MVQMKIRLLKMEFILFNLVLLLYMLLLVL